MIKQFNFYDLYGYLIPGIVLMGLLWVPIGVLTKAWPDQDLSKALFLAALAYVAGHVLQTIATSVVPSKVLRDAVNRPRFPSDLLLDKSYLQFGEDFKLRLTAQIQEQFGIDLGIAQDGDGLSEVSRNRATAFFQARSYLIAKKTAHYVEQFEGLYAMMRGLACSLLAGALYIAGWGLAFHRDQRCLGSAMAVLMVIGIGGALISSLFALSRNANVCKSSVFCLAFCLLLVFLCAGFWVGNWQPLDFWKGVVPQAEWILWASSCLACVASVRCFSAYRSFAILFAQSVWRDFSAYLTFAHSGGSLGNGGSQND